MNIYVIAEKAGVSIATVSRVINNSGYVGKNTKKRILDIIEKNNYMPSKTAQNLSSGVPFKLIGIVCYNIEDLYYAKAVAVLQRELNRYGYDIILTCTGESREQRQESVNMLIAKNADAIIFIGSVFAGTNESVIIEASKHLPVFIINAVVKGNNIHCAYCDESETINECVKKLHEKGRKKILFVYDVETYGGNMKLKGYKKGISECKLDTGDEYILKCSPGIPSAAKAFNEFLKTTCPDAVICTNDVTAVGILSTAKEKGMDVPKDLSVIGYNNSLIAECASPRLTSLENNVEKLSVFTAENIKKYFSGDNAALNYKTDFKLIIRETL